MQWCIFMQRGGVWWSGGEWWGGGSFRVGFLPWYAPAPKWDGFACAGCFLEGCLFTAWAIEAVGVVGC